MPWTRTGRPTAFDSSAPNTASVNASGSSWRTTGISDQGAQLALGCRENAPHDGVGFRMYARPVERIVTVAAAQEPCRKLESLGPEPRYLLQRRANAKRTMRLAVTDDAARQSVADAGNSRQQRR